MTARYTKTDEGREEIRLRARALSRPARNLLLIIDGTRSGAEWLALVGGSAEADLGQLIDSRLVEELVRPTVARNRAAVLELALQGLSYRELYDRLTAEARKRFGLIKGYRMVLEIEKCSGAEEIRKLALRFVDDVRAAQGDEAARVFCRELGAEV